MSTHTIASHSHNYTSTYIYINIFTWLSKEKKHILLSCMAMICSVVEVDNQENEKNQIITEWIDEII